MGREGKGKGVTVAFPFVFFRARGLPSRELSSPHYLWGEACTVRNRADGMMISSLRAVEKIKYILYVPYVELTSNLFSAGVSIINYHIQIAKSKMAIE